MPGPRPARQRLGMELDRIPLWTGGHVGVKQFWDHFCQYLYLPPLRDAAVLLGAVADGPAQTTWIQDGFAYAAAWDEEASRYRGLVANSSASVCDGRPACRLRPEPALRQLKDERPTTRESQERDTSGRLPGPKAGEVEEAGPTEPTRFYGRVRLDPLKLSSQAGEIADAIVQHLASLVNAEVTITLGVEADIPEGANDSTVRTVTGNARTLGFDSHGFESDAS